MADNILLPSHGTTVATDDVGGVHFTKVKISTGDAGVDGGLASSSNPLPVLVSATDPVSTDATMHHILRFLQILAGKFPMPNAAQQMPVVLPANTSVNLAQVSGQTAATGLGVSGNGVARVTPANDTVAGVNQTWAFQQSFDIRNFRNRIVT